MMYITLEGERLAREWHVGEPSPIEHQDACGVTEVQADGDELLHVIDLFAGIPVRERRVLRWFGDDAKFIAANLTNGFA